MQIDLERRILEHVGRPGYQPVKPRVIAKKLGLPVDQRGLVRRIVKKLVRRNQVVYGSNHLVYPVVATTEKGTATGSSDAPRSKSKTRNVVGRFQRAQAGFGFVRPEGTARDKGRDDDIFVPAEATLDAVTGDVVEIELSRKRGRFGQFTGTIVEIVKRQTHQFVGSYFEDDNHAYVQVDGNTFTKAIQVGDPGAKRVSHGDKVVIEMVRFPTPRFSGEGVITQVLGDRAKPGVDTELVMAEFSLPRHFPDEVLEDARHQADKFDESIGEDRRDLTDSVIITIDPKDARDFDDAISLEIIDNDHWRLGVHIADVSHFVRPNTAIDDEAKDRATSIYLPDRVIPMIPEIISNNLASLQPNKVRYAKTAFIEFTPDGARVATETCSAAIKSQHRFNYEDIDDYLERPHVWQRKLTPEVFSLVNRMHRLAMILRKRRMDRGSLELTMPELKLELDADGKVVGARGTEHTVSHQIIEEFMLAANEAVAQKLHDAKVIFLRRIHEDPDPRKLKTLTEFARFLQFDVESLESRFEIKRLLEEVAGNPEQHAVNFAVLRSMKKAVYGPDEEGHYALASDNYCHFTSPIRRYPDLVIHRQLDQLNRGKKPVNDFGKMANLGDHCSEREHRAQQAERELTKLKLLHYMNERIGDEMEVVVTGVEKFGIFAQGTKLPAEGLIAIDSLADDYYEMDDATMSLSGRRSGNAFRLGDQLLVQVAGVDLDRRELDYSYVEHISEAPRSTSTSTSTSTSKTKSKSKSKMKKNRDKDKKHKTKRGDNSKQKKRRR